ncbi:unnamed protein product [Urochloa humidicola]
MASQGPEIRGSDGAITGGAGAASNDGVLPQDVLYEILLCAPARTLCRFRAVCQSWRSLLTDPPFVAAHAARHCSDPLFAVAVDVVGGSMGNIAEIKLLDTSGHAVKTVSTGMASPLIQMRSHLDLVLLRSLACVGLRLLDPATGAVSSLPIPDSSRCNRSSFVLGRAVSSTGAHGEYKVLTHNSTIHAEQPWKLLTVDGSGSGGTWRVAPTPPVIIKAFGGNGTIVAKGVIYHLVDKADTWLIAAFC